MKRLVGIGIMVLLAGCGIGTQREGERCNPARFTSDCDPGLSCVYPTAPNCGVAYCCAVDGKGNITDKDPSCQPDPAAAAACMLDLGVASATDGGTAD